MAKPNGRPQSNVFTAYRRKAGKAKGPGAPLLKAHRALYLGMHKNWGNNPEYRLRLKSFRYREEGKCDWEYWRAAEMAMLVMGRWSPEEGGAKFLPLDEEAMRFLHWCRGEVARNVGTRGGRKLNPDAIFKTALSALVARKLLQPNGGNSQVLPSAREISQVWYVLFEEKESHEAIRGRLRRTGQFCEGYGKEFVPKTGSGGNHRKFASLGRAILRRAKSG